MNVVSSLRTNTQRCSYLHIRQVRCHRSGCVPRYCLLSSHDDGKFVFAQDGVNLFSLSVYVCLHATGKGETQQCLTAANSNSAGGREGNQPTKKNKGVRKYRKHLQHRYAAPVCPRKLKQNVPTLDLLRWLCSGVESGLRLTAHHAPHVLPREWQARVHAEG